MSKDPSGKQDAMLTKRFCEQKILLEDASRILVLRNAFIIFSY